MSTSKNKMKNEYKMESSCTPVNKTGIRNAFCGYPRCTTICYLNQKIHREQIKQPFKTRNLQDRELWVSLITPYCKENINLFLL